MLAANCMNLVQLECPMVGVESGRAGNGMRSSVQKQERQYNNNDE
jgi:hypothetical protein